MVGDFAGTPTEFLIEAAAYCRQRYQETGKTLYLEVADSMELTIARRGVKTA